MTELWGVKWTIFMPTCANCGSTVPEDAVYCGRCGSTLNSQSPGNRTLAALQSERPSSVSEGAKLKIRQELKGLEMRVYVTAILALIILALLMYILFL